MRQQLMKEKAQRPASYCLSELTAFRARQLWGKYFRHVYASNGSWASFRTFP